MALYISDANGQLKKVAGNQRTVDLSDVYPVGSIYMSINSTSPAGLFGGSWTQLPANYALWTATSGAGNTISAGLPNLKGNLNRSYGEVNMNDSTGVFNNTTSTGYYKNGFCTSWLTGCWQFDASRYNSIYSDSVSTVQPPAYKVYAWRRIS